MPEQPPIPAPVPAPVSAPKKRGCLFFAGIAAALFLAVSLLAVFAAVSAARSLLRAYTGTSALALPAPSAQAQDSESIAERVKAFRQGRDKSEEGRTLTLSADELNALIEREPPLRGKMHVAIGSDTIKGRASIPLKGSGIPFVGDRYFNVDAAFKVSHERGVLIITAEELVLNEKPFSEGMMNAIRAENLSRELYRRPQTAEILRKFESIQVKNGKLTIKLRGD